MELLTESKIETTVATALASMNLAGQRLLVLVPDHTRTMPLPLFFRLICDQLLGAVAQLDFMVALGTHPPLDEQALLRLFGISAEERATRYAAVRLINHTWDDPQSLTLLGTIPADEIGALSGGLLHAEVPVRLNRAVLDYDQLLVCGPVFPHEVVGMSGGNKYFFPGISGPEVIDFTHWLGALITSYEIIGVSNTPVRQVIDRAAALIPTPRHALCCVTSPAGTYGVFFGTPEAAHREAAELAAQVHIRYVDQPYQQVLSVLPLMYDEIWVGSKGMYKLEPVVADGGELVIYAPHISDFSATHGAVIRQIGFHVRDYFVLQWEKFKHLPLSVIAHSTHLRGMGSFDPQSGIERPRIRVTLATGISAADCQAVNLGYRDPASIDVADWAARSDPGLLVVPRAGEVLYRLASER